jgi:hypothetical protein
MLIKSLDSSALVLCAGEIFHTGPNIHHVEYRFPHSLAKKHAGLRFVNSIRIRGRVKRHLKWFYDTAGIGVSAVGFKLMTSQTRTFPWLMKLLCDISVSPIYLRRKDVFATAVSYYRAKATGHFHSDRNARSPASGALAIDEIEFRRILKLCVSNKRQIEELHAKHGGLLLSYEDMIKDWSAFLTTIGNRIGVEDLQVQMALAKLQPSIDSHESVVDEMALRERFSAEVAE